MKIAILLTVHNRKEKTLSCLNKLYSQLPINGYEMDVYLTDDGSTDGTAKVVIQQFPQINIIKGDGNLFWNRGMLKAWSEAAKIDYDFYLWLNDDTILYENALMILLTSATKKQNSIIVGSTNSLNNDSTTYGGYVNNQRLSPNGKLQECDYFNGNCVIIPRIIYHTIGKLDAFFRHGFGDFEYGLRAKKKGFKSYIAPSFIGTCERNPPYTKWLDTQVNLKNRLKFMYSPLGYNPFEAFYLNRRYKSLAYGLILFIHLHIKCIFPNLSIKKHL